MHGGTYRHHAASRPPARPWGRLAAVVAVVVLLAVVVLMAVGAPSVAPLERRLPVPAATGGLSAPAQPYCRAAPAT